jgi:hypothetical protein
MEIDELFCGQHLVRTTPLEGKHNEGYVAGMYPQNDIMLRLTTKKNGSRSFLLHISMIENWQPIMDKKIRLRNLYSVKAFAEKKGVSKQAVFGRITKGDIIPEYIGADADIYIDWKKYKKFAFDESFRRNVKG